MNDPDVTLDDWDPLPLADVVALKREFPERWWVSGAHALELHLGRSWREHDDIDIGIRRQDVPLLGTALPGWEGFVASAGRLSALTGRELSPERHENNVWPMLLDPVLSS